MTLLEPANIEKEWSWELKNQAKFFEKSFPNKILILIFQH